ncbi:restriction endonuclease subunit S [Staphylococcus aureus]|uniref:restriction endonuclease subunit S n=1 Tax=Staphylococcus aureus TaxID=1280 RepID=UPI000FDE50D2|nr:restriction endonuclease subunit S [Staphylococcus aureus]
MEFRKLGEFCTVKGGKRLPKGTQLQESKTNHPYLRIKDFNNGNIDINNLMYISEEVFNKISNYTINKGNIFLSIVGTIGLVDVIEEELDKSSLTENAVKIYSNDEKQLSTEFLSYYLKSTMGQHEIRIRTVGSTQPKLAITRIKDINVPMIDIKKQYKITWILSNIDKKIKLNRTIIANLEELSQTLFKRWFVDFEFPDENGAPYKANGGEMTNSELGEIPKAWRVETLEKLGSIIGGGTPSKKNKEYYTNNGIPWITPKDLSKNRNIYISHGENDISELGLNKSSAKLLEKNSVLFSSRAPIGYIAINNMPVTTNQGFKSIVPNEEMNPYFIYFILKNITPLIEQTASGSTFKEISAKGMKSIKIVFPSIELIKQYGNIVKKYFEEINFLENQNIKLIELRDTLLPKLMSGELEIPDDVEVNTDELSI